MTNQERLQKIIELSGNINDVADSMLAKYTEEFIENGSSEPYQFNSFLDRQDLPLGLRNNNPGNLRRTKIAWKGEIPDPENKGKGFERFEFIEYGIRAMAIDLIGDIKKDGLNTIEKLINEYAPPNENNTPAYIKHVCDDTGLHYNEEIPLNEGMVFKLLNSITVMELGIPANLITAEMVRKGISMINSGARAYLDA